MMQPNNGIFIATWYDDPQDTALFDLIPLLEELIHTRVRVPDLLNKYRDQIPIWAGFGHGDFGDPSFDQFDAPPAQAQPEPPQQQRQPMVSNAGAPAEPGRFAGPGPSPPAQPVYSTPYQQSATTAHGYPDQQQQQQ